MPRLRRYLPLILVSVVGLTTYFTLAKELFSFGLSNIVDVLCHASPALLIAAIAVRASSALLEGLVFASSSRAVGHGLSLRDSYRGICAALAMEYVLPVGGLTELYKVFFCIRRGYKLHEAVQIMFVHRTSICTGLAVMTIVALSLVHAHPWLELMLYGSIAALITTNIVGITMFIGSLAKSVYRRFLQSVVPVDIDSLTAFRPNPLRVRFVALALAIALIEHFAIAVSGYLTSRSLGIGLDYVQSILVFDVVQSTLWLLPAITPGSLGVLETFQLLALKGIGMGGAAAAIPLAYRIVVMVSMMPQLIPHFIKDVSEFMKTIESRKSLGTSTASQARSEG